MKRIQKYFKKPYQKRTPGQYNRMLAGVKRKYQRKVNKK
jgi:hypothetical protein